MEFLPDDPEILVSSVNMLLRDEEFDSLESLCYYFNTTPEKLKEKLIPHGYVYAPEQLQIRPMGYNIPEDCIETAYAFFHQKERIYRYSTLEWQKDDIEYAIDSYTHTMNKELYSQLSGGNDSFLRDHVRFHDDLCKALRYLDMMLS